MKEEFRKDKLQGGRKDQYEGSAKNFIFSVVMIFITILLILIFRGCSPGNLVTTGYLVGVDNYAENEIEIEHFQSTDSVDNWITEKTELQFHTPDLISEGPPYWEFNNEDFYIYVEKKGIYEKNGNGNCWEACILSITELDSELLPNINEEKYKKDWDVFASDMIDALNFNGFEFHGYSVNEFEDTGDFVIAVGDSPRGNGVKHAVVWRYGIVHDPHPSNAGLNSIDFFEKIEKLK